MEKLNNESLLLIFEYLPIVDKIKIERVCKRWRALSQRSWSNLKRLDFREETWTSRYGKNIKIDDIIVDKVLKHSVKYLTAVNFSHLFEKEINSHFHVRIVRNICEWCPKIEELVVTGAYGCGKKCEFGVSESCKNEHIIVPWLKLRSRRLKKLGLRWFHYTDSEKDIADLFATMQKLKSFYVCSAERLLLKNCMEKLPLKNLEEIIFTSASSKEEWSKVNSIITECSDKLRTIYMEFMQLDLASIIEALLSHCNLKNLLIKNIFLAPSQRKTLLSYVSKLIHLETLNVELMPLVVNDEFLKVVTENCKQLKELNVTNCYNITNTGISRICSLESLRCLFMANLTENVYSPPLEKLKKLEKLDCCYCMLFQCNSLIALVQKASGLQILDVRYCSLVTNELLTAAIDAVKRPGKKSALHILTTYTKIDAKLLLEDIPPLLKLHD